MPRVPAGRRPQTGLVVLAITLIYGFSAGKAQEMPMLLDVSVNSRPLDLIGNFQFNNGVLLATAREWRSLGLIVPPSLAPSDKSLIALAALPGVRGTLNSRQQTLSLSVDPTALIPDIVDVRPDEPVTTVDSSHPGAVLNYNLLATQSAGTTLASGLFDTRFYGSAGVLDTNEIASNQPDTPHVIRLDTTYTYSDPERLRQVLAGDVLTSGLAWTRTLRLAGLQFSSDFNLQPNLVTFPVPSIRGSVAVPSTVDLLINGIREFSQSVPAGAFELHQIPVVTGTSNVAVVVRNALGQETVQNLPFYTSSTLLSKGLNSYGWEIGAVRRNYGFESDDYGIPAFNASVRHGFTDWFTGEGHSEATSKLALGGFGASIRLGRLGVLSGAAAASKSGRQGYLYSLGFDRQNGRLSVNFSATRTSSGYEDIAQQAGDIGERSVIQAGVGLSLNAFGFLGVSYNAIAYRSGAIQLFDNTVSEVTPSNERVVSATYSVQFHRTISLYATSFADLSDGNSYGMTIGFSVPLGARSTAGGSVSSQDHSTSVGVQASQAAIDPGDLGWNLNLAEGRDAQRQAELDYKSSFAEASAAVDQTTGSSAARIGLTGAVVAAAGGLFPTNTIDDGFAVVRTGNLAGIPVLRENRVVGTTDSEGRLLIPDLRAYQDNTLAIDPLSLPVDVQVGQLSRTVRPANRSGVVVDFAIKRGSAARFALTDSARAPLPVGTMVTVDEGPETAPVGFDGTTYLTDLPAAGTLNAALPDGGACAASFTFVAKPGQIPLIGPLTCR